MTTHGWRRRCTIVLVATLALGAAAPAGSGPPQPHPRIDGNLTNAAGMVEVEIRGRNGASPVAALNGRGASSVVALGDVVFATVPAAALPAIANHPMVGWIRPASRPLADAITGQGVGVTDADDWQAFGVTGSGIDIAVIDAGFFGYQGLQNSGDLPMSLDTVNHCDDFEGTEHGAAVAEIVHEMAPGAALHLICVDSGSDLVAAVSYAENNGIDVISESLSWYPPGRGDGTGFLEPMLQDATDAGIVWVNSAGNQALSHWGGTFVDVDTDDWHDFDGPSANDEENTFSLFAGDFIYVILRWDDWGGAGSDNDFAVHLFKSDDTLLASSNSAGNPDFFTVQPQTGTQEPMDWFFYISPSDQDVYIKIEKVSATETPEMDLFVTLSGDDLENFTTARSITDPGTSPLVVAAGAADWIDGTIEFFSSRGPTIGGFMKPEITGPDGVSTATYDPKDFFGTSASAPHVAAAFALLLDAAPCLGAFGTKILLAELAEDRGGPGPDNTYGAGLLRLRGPATVADTTGCVLRRSGSNRYATAAAVSAAHFSAPTSTVFIATGVTFPDGLAGAAVAAKLGAPLLLTAPTNLPPETAAELVRLDPNTIVVLGGPGAVSDGVLTALEGYAPTVTRVFGNNRYDTAVAVSQYGFPDAPTPPAGTVFVATGLNFPDALAAGAAAAKLGGTVLLVPGSSLPASVANELTRLDPETIVIVGGTSAVSDTVFTAIDGLQGDDTVIRISGSDRYTTATGLSLYAFPGGTEGAFMATGLNFPDALAGAAAAGASGWPVLLVPANAVPGAVQGEIDRLTLETLFVLGGTGAVSAAVERALEDGLG